MGGNNAPKQGMIIFADPAQRSGVWGRRVPPIKIVYMAVDTADEESGIYAETGRVEYLGGSTRRRVAAPDVQKPLKNRHLMRSRPTNLSGNDFAALWRALEEAGLFELREHSGNMPPEDQPYFLLDDTRRQRIFLRPPRSARQQSGIELERTKVWNAAKRQIVAGM